LQVFKGAPKRHKKSGKAGSATLKTKMTQPLSIEHEKQARIPDLCGGPAHTRADASFGCLVPWQRMHM
jgi:hypothetical protein